MQEQTLIQVRIDTALKEEATAVFEEIGMDMPTAIRMFLKRTVVNHCFPFEIANTQAVSKKEALPNKTEIKIPASPFKMVSNDEFVDLLLKVPKGKLIRTDDIYAYFSKKYHIRVEFDYHYILKKDGIMIPYWRIVSSRGYLMDYGQYHTKEAQAEILTTEGFEIIQNRSNQRSMHVKNYKEYLFDISEAE